MRANRKTLALGLVLGCALTAAGCNSSADDDDTGGCTPVLTFVSDQEQNLAAGATADLMVMVSTCELQPFPDRLVSFTIKGEAGGAGLSALSANSDDNGQAMVTLTAGATDATFEIEVTSKKAEPITFAVNVGGYASGYILVNMTYGGQIMFTEFTAHLFQGVTCAQLSDPFALPQVLMTAPAVASITAQPKFTVPAGQGFAVVVLAKAGTATKGYGCDDSLEVTGGRTTQAQVDIDEIDARFRGVYKLDNRFNLGNSLPPSVSNTISLVRELADDQGVPDVGHPCVANDLFTPMPHYCGIDPAAFILDFVYRYIDICSWSCDENADYDTCPQHLNHQWTDSEHLLGDVSALYEHTPFEDWDYSCSDTILGVGGLCWVLRTAHPSAQDYVQDQIPVQVQSVANIAGDLTEAVMAMHILSELTITQGSGEFGGNFTHELKQMVVTVHNDFDNPSSTQDYTFPLNASTGFSSVTQQGAWTSSSGGVLTIPNHSFTVHLGKLIQYIYVNIILDQVFDIQGGTAGLLAQWINCTAVGAELSDLLNGLVSEDTCEDACDWALTAAGSLIDAQIASQISITTTLTLNGTVKADQVNSQQVADALKDGAWNGAWSEGAHSGTFTGTFTGTR